MRAAASANETERQLTLREAATLLAASRSRLEQLLEQGWIACIGSASRRTARAVASSWSGLIAPLGRAGAAKVPCPDFGRGTAHHALVAGRVGAGKSTLLHTMIASLALAYSPQEVQLYLIDFKKGVEFKTYAEHQLPTRR